jgi:hypothetical protein
MVVGRALAHGAAVDTAAHGQRRVSAVGEGVVIGKRGRRQECMVERALSVCGMSEWGGEAPQWWPMEMRVGSNRQARGRHASG